MLPSFQVQTVPGAARSPCPCRPQGTIPCGKDRSAIRRDVVFGEEHTRRPDFGVVREATFDVNPTPASDIALLAEVSPGSEHADRTQKPEEYATAGIPAYWRIETRGVLALIAYELVGDTYIEHPPVTDVFTTRQPWQMSIDVPDLGRIGRKPES